EEGGQSPPCAGTRRARVRRLSEQAEGRPDRAPEADQPPRRTNLRPAPSWGGSRSGERRALDGQGCRAGDRLPRLASATASWRAQRVSPEFACDRSVPGDGGNLQPADRVPAARRRDQKLRRRAPRAARRVAGRRVLRTPADRPDSRSTVLRTPEPP